MYPRFSETFVVTEILAMEEHGADIEILSLRPRSTDTSTRTWPRCGRRSPTCAQRKRAATCGTPSLGAASCRDSLDERLPHLLEVDAEDATQAVEVASLVVAHGV